MRINSNERISPQSLIGVLACTLFASRAGAELGALVWWPLGALAGGLIGAALGFLVGRILLPETAPPGRVWPVYLLYLYVLYPALDLRLAAFVLMLAVLAAGFARWPSPRPRPLDFAVFLGALALYWSTLSPGLLPADAGEFQLVAAHLGVAHPPGYPLYTLLGKAFTLLMPTNPARGLSLFSAVTAALAVTLAGRAARRLGGNAWAGLAASASLAVMASFWATASQASIRPLTAFFTALCLDRLAAYRRTGKPSTLTAFGLSLGLGIAHHPSLVFPGLFFVIYLLLIEPPILLRPARWLQPVGGFLLGFLPWLYFPLRAALIEKYPAPYAPLDLATWGGFWRHVLARGFSGDLFYFRTPTELADRLAIWLNILALQWNLVLPVLAVLAALILARRDWRMLLLLGGGIALHSLVTMTYRAPQTVEYLAPAYVLLAVLLGAGLGKLAPQGEGRSGWAALRAFGVALTLAASTAVLIANRPSLAYLAHDDSTREYAVSLFEAAPPDAVILANWHWYTPLRALQALEGVRPDVELVYVYPEGAEPLAQTWLRRIEANVDSRPVVVTGFYPAEFAASPYFFEPLAGGWRVRTTPRADLPADLAALDQPFEGGLTLVGAGEVPPIRVGETFQVALAWRVDAPLDRDVTAFVHFTNASGQVIAGSDRLLPTGRARPGDVLVERYTLGMPPSGLPSSQDSYQLQAGLYAVDQAGVIQPIRSADGLERVPVATVVVDPARWPAPTGHPRHAIYANGARLRGFDWEGGALYLHVCLPDGSPQTVVTSRENLGAALDTISGGAVRLGPWGLPLPAALRIPDSQPGERYVALGQDMVLVRADLRPARPLAPGQAITIDLTLLSARPLLVDDVTKVDLVGEGYAWRAAPSDHVPASGAIPTLKWLYGWRVLDRHRLAVPADASTTNAYAEMSAYDHFTGQTLPLLDPALAQQGIAVPLYRWEPEPVPAW
jgi:hypothetical protein